MDATLLPYLPLDIIQNILRCLPAKSLLQFKYVCKAWLRIIHMMRRNVPMSSLDARLCAPGYIHSLVNYSRDASLELEPVLRDRYHDIQLPDKLKEVFRSSFILQGPCEGVYLVFDVQPHEKHAALWNHATGDCMIISPEHEISIHNVVYGFGRENFVEDGECTDDFLVLKFYYGVCSYQKHVPKLYRSSIGSWKAVETFPYDDQIYWINPHSVYVDGVIYWLAYGNAVWFLISFDTRRENFGKVDIPDSLQEDNDAHFSDKLLLSCYTSHGNRFLSVTMSTQKVKEVWVMRVSDVGRHWVKEASIKGTMPYSERKTATDPKADIWYHTWEYEDSFVSLDSKSRMMERQLLKGIM